MSARTVLVVEDEDGIRLSLRDYLQCQGYTVYVASDGVGAIKQLLDHPVDAIVTDYRMEGLGGDYWIRFLRSFYADRKVVVTSGYIEPDAALSFPVIAKPFDYDALSDYLQEAPHDTSPSLN